MYHFVDYAVWHSTVKGEGSLDVGILQEPVAFAPTVEIIGNADSHGPRFAGEYQVVDLKGFEPSTS